MAAPRTDLKTECNPFTNVEQRATLSYVRAAAYTRHGERLEYDVLETSLEEWHLLNRMSGMCEDEKDLSTDESFDPEASYPPEVLDTDFKRRYPPDPFGDEVEPHARVWTIYRDEAQAHDEPMIDGWNKTLDILLIFAGLFSAVASAFIVEAYKALVPAYDAYMAHALYTLVSSGSGTVSLESLSGIGDPSTVSVSSYSRWINGLWFMSVTLALIVALLSILVKQWLQHYVTRVGAPSSSPRQWTRRRSLYYEGLLRWHLPGLISTLPLLLHVSLFLFLAGLVVFVWNIDQLIGMGLLGLTSSALGFYVFSFVTPALKIDCPSMTPLLEHILSLQILSGFLIRLLTATNTWVRRSMHEKHLQSSSGRDKAGSESQSLSASFAIRIKRFYATLSRIHDCVRFTLHALRNMRLPFFYMHYIQDPIARHVGWSRKTAARPKLDERDSELDAATISWLVRSSANDDTVSVALQATGSLHPGSRATALLRLDAVVRRKVRAAVNNTIIHHLIIDTKAKSRADFARFLRVALAQTPEVLIDERPSRCPPKDSPLGRDYDLCLLSHVFHCYDRFDPNATQILPIVYAPTPPGSCSPFLDSTVILVLGRSFLSLETRLALLGLLEFSKMAKEHVHYAAETLILHVRKAGHGHASPCNLDCLLDVLSEIALTSAEHKLEYRSWEPAQSVALSLIRRLQRSRNLNDIYHWLGADKRPGLSGQSCLGLIVPHFLDLLTSGRYDGSSQEDWTRAAWYLSDALCFYGPTRISPMRCKQLLQIVSTALCSSHAHERTARWMDLPRDNFTWAMSSLVDTLFMSSSLFIYRTTRLVHLQRVQFQLVHDTSCLSDGLLPLLQRNGDIPSPWSIITAPTARSDPWVEQTAAISLVLGIQLCCGVRRGIPGISSLVDEFFAYDWGRRALRETTGLDVLESDFAAWALHMIIQHCVDLKPDWWTDVRANVDMVRGVAVPENTDVCSDPPREERLVRNLRNYDRWVAKQRPGPCVMCAGCKPLNPETV